MLETCESHSRENDHECVVCVDLSVAKKKKFITITIIEREWFWANDECGSDELVLIVFKMDDFFGNGIFTHRR